MRKLAAVFALMASPALATGISIDVAGEGANGTIQIDLLENIAPGHVERITKLASEGQYDGVYFHRVIDGFMAQTGDVQCAIDGATCPAGTGGSELPDLVQEFSSEPFERGVVGMARSQNPNSANSQFFIMFEPGYFLNNQYTVVGRVTEGFEVLDAIKRGNRRSGAIDGTPDQMVKVSVTEAVEPQGDVTVEDMATDAETTDSETVSE